MRLKSTTREAIVIGSLAAASFAVRAALEWAWERQTDRPAPKNPAAEGVGWRQALLWGGSIGVVTGLVRTAVRRSYSSLPHWGPRT